MPLQVVPATEADAARAIVIERRAFGPNPIEVALFPGPFPADDTSQVDHMVEQLRTTPACRWMKVIDTELAARGEEDMISFSKWFIWEGESSLVPRKWGPGTVPEACELFMGEMTTRWRERFQGKPHVYLKMIHTDPIHQRRRAGAMLLKWGTDEADRLGLVSYLEASSEGRGLYEKFGFREVDSLRVDLSKWGGPSDAAVDLMLREPRHLD